MKHDQVEEASLAHRVEAVNRHAVSARLFPNLFGSGKLATFMYMLY